MLGLSELGSRTRLHARIHFLHALLYDIARLGGCGDLLEIDSSLKVDSSLWQSNLKLHKI